MGRLVARELQGSTTVWTDPEARDGSTSEACYTVESYYLTSGNTSQRAQPVCWWGRDAHRVRSFTAHDLRAMGGTASNNHGRFHYENWGDEGHTLELPFFRPDATGEHLLQVIASNGSGGFTTGITCAVKRVRVQELPGNTDVATGYLVMPQTGTWEAWRGSSFVRARLEASRTYRVIIDSDPRAVNMSSFAHFERYNGGTGGRGGAFARVNIAELRVLPLHAGTGTGATVTLNGSGDLERFNPETRVTPGVLGASTDAVALTWDDGFIYAAVRARALVANDLRPFVMYFDTREGDERFGTVATRAGLPYLDQTPTLPFEATWALLLRRRNDAGDGAGPFNGLFRWEGTRWVRTMRFVEGRDFWPGTDPERTLSLRITRASLGMPRRMRLAGHAVLGGGLYQCTVPEEHQPWTAGRTTGFFEVDLTVPPSPARLWPRR
jgi:hypothetical protein